MDEYLMSAKDSAEFYVKQMERDSAIEYILADIRWAELHIGLALGRNAMKEEPDESMREWSKDLQDRITDKMNDLKSVLPRMI